jgi:hypothetical protein
MMVRSLRSYAEILILVNSVLDSLPIYSMAAMLLPKGIIVLFDKTRHVFLCGQGRILVVVVLVW